MREPLDIGVLLESAATNMDAAAVLLTTGDSRSMDESGTLLQQAIEALNGLGRVEEKWRAAATRLQQKSRALGRLLREADRFHTGAFGATERSSGGYTSGGAVSTYVPARTFSVVL